MTSARRAASSTDQGTLERRQLKASSNIIYALVSSQAGSLGKAVLEGVMNSIDGGATRIDITMTATKLKIADDGQGFGSEEEITACFDVLGFDHHSGPHQKNRTFGEFGIGRAQLWNFCSTVWRTNAFSMAVDIKNRGFDYDFRKGLPIEPGLVIDGTFYTRQTPKDILDFEKEIADLARYVPCAVTVNGVRIDRAATAEKWTTETDDAWIRLKESGDLVIYNQGVKVCALPGYRLGTGGVVVTKPGVRLTLNMARNDILQANCAVWKRLKPAIEKLSGQRIKVKTKRPTEEQLKHLVQRMLAGDLHYEDDLKDVQLFKDVTGKWFTLERFASLLTASGMIVGVAARGAAREERAHKTKIAVFLDESTLNLFSVEKPSELQAVLKKWCDEQGLMEKASRPGFYRSVEYRLLPPSYSMQRILSARFLDDASHVLAHLKEDARELPMAEWSEHEKVVIHALERAQTHMLKALDATGVVLGENQGRRRLMVGESTMAKAWTYPSLNCDGRGRIVLSREEIKKAKMGVAGISALAFLIAHEYLHEDDSTPSHAHDMEFMDRYHTLVMHGGVHIGKFVTMAFGTYISQLRLKNMSVLDQVAKDWQRLDEASTMIETEDVEAVNAPPTEEKQKSAPRQRSRQAA